MGRTIEVEYDDKLLYDRDYQGEASYRFNKILLQPQSDCHPMPNIEQTFLHELLHWIVYFSGSSYQGKAEHMHQDEGFIDMTACLLHQALTTMEHEQ